MASSRNKKNDIFSKKVPINPKYSNVKTKLDTGASTSNYMNRIEEIRKNYRYRKDEIFKRMKVSTFAMLVLQVAEVCNLELDRLDLESSDGTLEAADSERSVVLSEKGDGSATDRVLLQDVVRGVGEIGVQDEQQDAKLQEDMKCKSSVQPDLTSLPYLLLDIRDKDAYDECHIIGSLNYPSSMLSRSVNYLSQEMLAFKNRTDKIILVYDADEKICPNVATVLVQREIDNVFMLSGGLKVLHKKFPSCFLTGKVPASCFSPKLDRKGNPKAPPNKVVNKGINWYTSELLENIQDSLDEVLLSNESSRLSSRTTARSTTSKMSGRDSNISSTTTRSNTSSQSSVSSVWR